MIKTFKNKVEASLQANKMQGWDIKVVKIHLDGLTSMWAIRLNGNKYLRQDGNIR